MHFSGSIMLITKRWTLITGALYQSSTLSLLALTLFKQMPFIFVKRKSGWFFLALWIHRQFQGVTTCMFCFIFVENVAVWEGKILRLENPDSLPSSSSGLPQLQCNDSPWSWVRWSTAIFCRTCEAAGPHSGIAGFHPQPDSGRTEERTYIYNI